MNRSAQLHLKATFLKTKARPFYLFIYTLCCHARLAFAMPFCFLSDVNQTNFLLFFGWLSPFLHEDTAPAPFHSYKKGICFSFTYPRLLLFSAQPAKRARLCAVGLTYRNALFSSSHFLNLLIFCGPDCKIWWAGCGPRAAVGDPWSMGYEGR